MKLSVCFRYGLLAALAVGLLSCDSSDELIEPPVEWVVTAFDEFDGPEGARPNQSIWTYDVGGGGFGNEQLEFNSDRLENVSLDGQGNLRIIAREESFMGNDYTSGRIKTEGLLEVRYGRIEARIKLPVGEGLWPAFWMLGNNFNDVGWPEAGEIDIMEFVGRRPDRVFGSLHGPGYSGVTPLTNEYELPDEAPFTDDFHVYAVDWDPSRIAWSVDNNVFYVVNFGNVSTFGDWVFDHGFFILLNLAVGGTLGGPVGTDTVFPAEMLVDYVRVFERVQ